jgi:hypothetical protein
MSYTLQAIFLSQVFLAWYIVLIIEIWNCIASLANNSFPSITFFFQFATWLLGLIIFTNFRWMFDYVCCHSTTHVWEKNNYKFKSLQHLYIFFFNYTISILKIRHNPRVSTTTFLTTQLFASYEYVIILPQFTFRTIMKERKIRSWK